MHQHLMIDLETLGVIPGCVITQIGLAAFNTDNNEIESMLICINMDSCFEWELFAQRSTLRWWLGQSKVARASMAEDGGLPLSQALIDLRDFYNAYAVDARVWSHGASFDEPILQVAAHKTGVKLPWHHGQIRDTRTLGDLSPDSERPKPHIAHHAESDAIAQAIWVRNMLRDLKK